MEYPVDRALRGQGRVLGIALAASFVLPWMSTTTRSWEGGRSSKMLWAWDLMGKSSSGAIMVMWFLIAGIASIVLSGEAIARKTRAQGYFALGVITTLLLAFNASEANLAKGGGDVTLLMLLHIAGLMSVAFGATHWASRPGAPLAKGAIASGIVLLAVAYLMPIAKAGRESKALISLIPDVFDANEAIFQLIGLYLLIPIAVVVLGGITLLPPGPGGPAERTPVAKAAGTLAMLYMPGLLIIMWFVVMKLSDYNEKMFVVVYVAILIGAVFAWTVLGLDAALLTEGPMPMGYAPPPPMGYPPPPPPVAMMGPPCPRCATPGTWVPTYNRWFCARCSHYM